jgi:hypothetical protein
MMCAGQSALLIGATGATGQYVLKELLASSHFTRVGEYGRRVTSEDNLKVLTGKEKLEQKTIDFEKLDESGLKEGKWDVIFITSVLVFFSSFDFSAQETTRLVSVRRKPLLAVLPLLKKSTESLSKLLHTHC